MAERLKATVLKIVSGVTRSRVRIPVPPPFPFPPSWARINSLPDEEKNSVLKHLQSKVVRLNSLSKSDPQ